jgi:hypothetical protein
MTLAQKFFDNIEVRGPVPKHAPELGPCWIWKLSKHPRGYGHIRHGKKILYAHRVCHELFYGLTSDGLHVCHRCDNPSCVNPNHLFLGTHKDNMQDMQRKNRNPGTKRFTTRLTPDLVKQVRHRVEKGEKQTKIAKELDVHASTIGDIVHFRKWKWV